MIAPVPRAPSASGAPARRRSVLSVPGSDERKARKALASSADQVVLDLEDAVEPGSKDRARALLVAVLSSLPASDVARVTVRVNAPRSLWCALDVLALTELPVLPGSLVLPKVEGPGDLAFLDRLLDGVEARSGGARTGVQALVETAAGVANLSETCGPASDWRRWCWATPTSRLRLAWSPPPSAGWRCGCRCSPQCSWRALRWGAGGGRAVPGRARRRGVPCGRAAGARPRLRRQVGHPPAPGRRPQRAVHPCAHRRGARPAVLDALDRGADESGAGAVLLDGQMLDEALAAAARRVLARAEDDA